MVYSQHNHLFNSDDTKKTVTCQYLPPRELVFFSNNNPLVSVVVSGCQLLSAAVYQFLRRTYYKDYVALTFLDTIHAYGRKEALL